MVFFAKMKETVWIGLLRDKLLRCFAGSVTVSSRARARTKLNRLMGIFQLRQDALLVLRIRNIVTD